MIRRLKCEIEEKGDLLPQVQIETRYRYLTAGKSGRQATFFLPGRTGVRLSGSLRQGMEMQFYIVSDAYIACLRSVDASVFPNYNEARPYIGIMLEVAGHKYLAPLTSYKPKHDKIKDNSLAVFKLHEPGNPANKLGMIQLNNMIPVVMSEVRLLDVKALDKKYQNLLNNQLRFIKGHQAEIQARAAKLYDFVVNRKHPHWCGLSCRFTDIEAACVAFEQAAFTQPVIVTA